MATVYIAEFQVIQDIGALIAQIASAPPVAEQTIAIGGASVSSAAFNYNTNVIRVTTDAICSIAIGVTPTATATTMRLSADHVEYFGVRPGSKIAVITNV